jgi:hypothetical protein
MEALEAKRRLALAFLALLLFLSLLSALKGAFPSILSFPPKRPSPGRRSGLGGR